MTLPIEPGLHPRDWPMPKRRIIGLTICLSAGFVGVVASVVSAVIGTTSQQDVRDDVRKNQQYLRATCENTRAITEQFASAEPSPCPTVEP